jgi:hypothetical protein
MNDEYGIGDAQQFFGTVAPWAQNEYVYGQDRLDLENLPAYISGQDRLDLENLPAFISGEDRVDLENLPAKMSGFGKVADIFKNIGGKALNFAGTNQGIMAILAAIAAAADRQRKSGGGAGERFAGPTPVTRTMTQGKYGPIARYAANGGLMQAYAQGGQVQMEDGGFVMTKKAVDGAGGPRGLASLVPGAKMIGGPPDPTGRKDLTPAVIHGPNGQTPAKVSRGEAYVPKRVVDDNGGAKEMYALMNSLQRRA